MGWDMGLGLGALRLTKLLVNNSLIFAYDCNPLVDGQRLKEKLTATTTTTLKSFCYLHKRTKL